MRPRFWKRTIAGILALALMFGNVPLAGTVPLFDRFAITASAGTLEAFAPRVTGITISEDETYVANATVQHKWPYGNNYQNAIVITDKKLSNPNNAELVSINAYHGSSLEESIKNCKWEGGEVNYSSSPSYTVRGSGASPGVYDDTIDFDSEMLPLDTEEPKLLYVYLWTANGTNYYPDCQIATIKIEDGNVYYGEGVSDPNQALQRRIQFTAKDILYYNGEPQALVTAAPAAPKSVDIQYAVTSTDVEEAPEEGWQSTSEVTEAGRYRVWCRVVEKEGEIPVYEIETTHYDVMVAKGDVAAIPVQSLTFDTTVQALVDESALPEGVSLVYTTEDPASTAFDASSWSETIPTGRDVKTYRIYYKAQDDTDGLYTYAGRAANYNVVNSTIYPAMLALDGVDETYDGEPHDLVKVPDKWKDCEIGYSLEEPKDLREETSNKLRNLANEYRDVLYEDWDQFEDILYPLTHAAYYLSIAATGNDNYLEYAKENLNMALAYYNEIDEDQQPTFAPYFDKLYAVLPGGKASLEDLDAFKASLVKTVEFLPDIPQGTDAGDYTVYFAPIGADANNFTVPNETLHCGVVKSTIAPASLELESIEAGYTGEPIDLVKVPEAYKDIEILYSMEEAMDLRAQTIADLTTVSEKCVEASAAAGVSDRAY